MKRNVILALIILFIIQVCATDTVFAQRFPFRTYSYEEGLTGSTVTDILQDREGYLWFATDNGIAKFDGIQFITYTMVDGLAGNEVQTILEDNEGNLWFGGIGGITKFDGEKFTTYTEQDGLAGYDVNSSLLDSDENLWFGTTGGGVSKFDGEAFTNYTTADGLPDARVMSMLEDSEGNLWIGTSKGLCKFDGNKFKKISLINISDTKKEPGISVIMQDKEGAILFGFWNFNPDKPLRIIIYENETFKDYGKINLLPGAVVNSIEQDTKGNLWFGTSSIGVVKYDGITYVNYTTENGLAHNNVRSILEDSEGNLWFGTQGGDVSRLNGEAFATYTTENGLVDNNIRSIFEDSEGNLWFGTALKGIIKFDGRIFTSFYIKDGMFRNSVISIIEDREGNLWFGFNGKGVSKFNGKIFSPYTDSLAHNNVGSMFEDSEGNLWFGTIAGDISKFNGETFTTYNEKHGLHKREIMSIFEDSKGNIWININERGAVSRFDGSKFRTYTTEDGLPNARIRVTLEDKKGNLWFGSGGGICRFNGKTFATYTTKDGLGGNHAMPVCEDSSGDIWFFTNKGMSKFNGREFTSYYKDLKSQGSFEPSLPIQREHCTYIPTNIGVFRFDHLNHSLKRYTSIDGLASNNIQQNMSIKDSKGNLWFGTDKGVTRFNPRLERTNPVPPPIHITRLKIFDRETELTGGLELPHDENNIRFDYVGLCFTAPEDVIYRYQLIGFDKDWVETKDRFVAYSFLPPGDYTFKVKAQNNEGIWSEEPEAFSFVIHSPFWAKWWFRGLMGMLFIATIYELRQWDMRNARRRELELEQRVRERTSELAQVNIQLKELDRMKSMFIASMSHELRTPLNSIIGFTGILMMGIAGEITEEQRKQLTMVKNSANHLLALINDIIDVSKIEADKVELLIEEFDLSSLLQEVKDSLTVAVDEKGLKMPLKMPEKLVIKSDERRVKQIIVNIAGNAIKFTDEGKIDVKVEKKDKMVEVSVRDTGIGMRKEDMDKLFGAFSQIPIGGRTEEGTGLGLYLSKKIADLLGGEIWAESNFGKGSKFIFTLPLKYKEVKT